MARYRVMYWNAYPQSLIVEDDEGRVRKQLSQKVQSRIDAYAMATGLTSGDDYTAQYRRGDWIEHEGSATQVAEQVLAALEEEALAIRLPKKKKSAAPDG